MKNSSSILKEQKPLKDKIYIIILSLFYVGFLPKAPGTWGSIFSIPLVYLFYHLELAHQLIILTVLTLIIVKITETIQKKYGLHDPQWIVFDETLGMLTTSLFLTQNPSIKHFILLTILFRIFDIVKIWPASILDKVKHGYGTILDDIVSAIYAGLCLNFFSNFI